MRLGHEPGEPGRIEDVDGLRALAALAVTLFHVGSTYRGDAPPPVPASTLGAVAASVVKMGAHGVDLFFVLSGFCLAYPTLRRVRAGGGVRFDLVSYAAKRLTRIVPPAWITIVLSIALLAPAGLIPHTSTNPLPLAAQFAFFDAGEIFVDSAFWTLPIELRWYVLFPFALWLAVRAPRSLAVVAAGCFVLEFATRASSIDVGALPLFLAGIWAADLRIRGVRAGGRALAVVVPAAIAAVLLEPPDGKQFYLIEPVGMLAAVAFVIAAGGVAPLRAFFAWRPLAALGSVSYSLYLLNVPILRLASAAHLPQLAGAVLAIGGSVAAAFVIELPFVRGPLRERCLAVLEPAIGRVADYLGLPRGYEIAPAAAGAVLPLGEPVRRSDGAGGDEARRSAESKRPRVKESTR